MTAQEKIEHWKRLRQDFADQLNYHENEADKFQGHIEVLDHEIECLEEEIANGQAQ